MIYFYVENFHNFNTLFALPSGAPNTWGVCQLAVVSCELNLWDVLLERFLNHLPRAYEVIAAVGIQEYPEDDHLNPFNPKRVFAGRFFILPNPAIRKLQDLVRASG